MESVFPHIGPQQLTESTWCGFGRIGGANDFSILLNGVFTLESHDDNGTAAHELRELIEERAFAVHGIETARFAQREVDSLHCANPETFVFKTLDDRPDFVLLDGVGFDDG